MTPNNEMLLQAVSDPMFFSILERSYFSVPDSTGVLLAAKLTGQFLPQRVPGVDLLERFCLEDDGSNPVFFLGAAPGVAATAARVLRERNPSLQIAGTHAGSPQSEDADAIIDAINASGAKALFVAFGSPAQDLWIARYATRMPGVRVAMGVGGSFDYLAGSVGRAPKAVRRIGLEWLWRVCLQPRRILRIFNATVKFPLKVLRYGRNRPQS